MEIKELKEHCERALIKYKESNVYYQEHLLVLKLIKFYEEYEGKLNNV